MWKRIAFTAPIAGIMMLCCVFHSASAQDKHTQIRKLMSQYHSYNMFEGAVLVADEGKVIYKNAFGLANREWNIPNGTDTKFMIGSVSKPLTATLVLRQVQKGLIDLTKPISAYLPEFKDKPAQDVTIRQLLMHTSGIANYDIIKDFFPRISRQKFTREEYVKIYADSALAFKPGTQYGYSSWGYFTLGLLIERVTGKNYAEAMREDVFNPARMTGSGSYEHTQIVANRATGYDYAFGGFTSSDFRDQSNTMGTGDIYATVDDLWNFSQALSSNLLLDANLAEEMFNPGMRPARYGYGWFNQNFRYTATDSVAANYHLGMTDGFISFMLRIPSTKSCVIILCNASPTDFFGITKNLVSIMRGRPVLLKQPLTKRIEKQIAEKGAAAAIADYNSKKADTSRYYTDKISMTFLADQLLKLNRPEEARLVSENNLLDFSDYDFALVTMGNIYLALNRKADARNYYEKALKISPGYEEARSRLKEITAF